MEDKRLRIGISGSYGGMNLGDEAILEAILGRLRATAAADITVFSKNPEPEDTLARHQVERAVSPRSLTRREVIPEIRQLDLLILGGGRILYDCDAEEYLREVFIANELEVPVMLYAISAGPCMMNRMRQGAGTLVGSCRLYRDAAVSTHGVCDVVFVCGPRDDPPYRTSQFVGPRLPARQKSRSLAHLVSV